MYYEGTLRTPDRVCVMAAEGKQPMERSGEREWAGGGVRVAVEPAGAGMRLLLLDAPAGVSKVWFSWRGAAPPGARILNDHWERGYGDLEWRGLVGARPLPWYFIVFDGRRSWALGVKTRPAALCHWMASPLEATLCCDVRSGAAPLRLAGRTLEMATVVSGLWHDVTPFHAAVEFSRVMCPDPLVPPEPVYGFNDWHYAYGASSRGAVLRDAALLADLSPSSGARPFCVVDDGWEVSLMAGPWDRGNPLFGDMGALAEEIKARGARPGLWYRPLMTAERLPAGWRADPRNIQEPMDPSVPEVLARIAEDIRRFASWGYELVKHDFTTFDVLGEWGNRLGGDPVTPKTLRLHDDTRTTAEVVSALYKTIRDAAPGMLVIGCNTIGHLAAGLVHVQRTGDDTSGRDWARTRGMGVNTLAFRMHQHGTFFCADADCVGLTRRIPWRMNRQWLELLSLSGTAVFVSPEPDAMGAEQRTAVRVAFDRAARPMPPAEPLDWMDNTLPRLWRAGGHVHTFDWFTGDGEP